MITAALALTLLADPAHAATGTEIGTARKLGIGAATGNGFISVTGKYWLKPTIGFAGYIGNGGELQQARVNFEMDLFTIRDMDVARLDLYWLAGVDGGMWIEPGYVAGKLGFGAGLGVNMKFNDWPMDAFLDVGAGGYPFDQCTSAVQVFCVLQPRADLGARYYFP